MSKKQAAVFAIAAACLTFGVPAAQASFILPSGYYPTVNVNLDACGNSGAGGCVPDGSDPGLWNPVIAGIAPFHGGVTFGFNTFLDGEYSGPIPTFPFGAGPFDFQPTGLMMFGWLDYLPSDGQTPSDHVVLFVDSSVGATMTGQTWDSLFNLSPGDPGNFTEAEILSDLQNLGGLNLNGADSVSNLFQFMDYYPNLLAAANGGTVDAIAFSTGTLVGTGTTSYDAVGLAPEPASWMLMLAGIGAAVVYRVRGSKRPSGRR